MQYLLTSFIAHSVTSLCEQFQFGFELGKRFRMDAKPSNTTRFIERVTEELDVPHTACYGLFAVDFQVEFLLYEIRYALLDAFRSSRSLAEDYAIIGIAHERMSASLQLLVKFVKNYVTEERAERATLRCADIALLHDTINHYSRFQILMYQRYYSAVLDCKG